MGKIRVVEAIRSGIGKKRLGTTDLMGVVGTFELLQTLSTSYFYAR